jgi:hypothetical protein
MTILLEQRDGRFEPCDFDRNIPGERQTATSDERRSDRR